MNATHGRPQGTGGTITFDTGVTRPAVRTADGRFYVQSVNPHLWLPASIRDNQFQEA